MGQFVSKVHNRQDDKLYNILPMGDMPTVVFGRTIKPNSVPGMQYYFADGVIKFNSPDEDKGYTEISFDNSKEEKHGKESAHGNSCIFTVPENFDWEKRDNEEYVLQFVRSAKLLNANTMSSDFIIRDGQIICVKKSIDKYVKIKYYRRKPTKRRCGYRYTTTRPTYFDENKKYHWGEILVIPINLRRKSSLSIYQYRYQQRYHATGNYNLFVRCEDRDGNYCYFRAAYLGQSGSKFRWRVSEFVNLDEEWQEYFDFDSWLHYGDILTTTYIPAIDDEGCQFYNTRLQQELYRDYVYDATGQTGITQKIRKYYPINTLPK